MHLRVKTVFQLSRNKPVERTEMLPFPHLPPSSDLLTSFPLLCFLLFPFPFLRSRPDLSKLMPSYGSIFLLVVLFLSGPLPRRSGKKHTPPVSPVDSHTTTLNTANTRYMGFFPLCQAILFSTNSVSCNSGVPSLCHLMPDNLR